jgi:nitrogen fixation protein FixH
VVAERRRFEPWPFALAAALALMIGVCIAFLSVAIVHPDPVTVQDSYAAEPALAEALRAQNRGQAQGWDLAVHTRAEEGGVAVEASLRDAAGRALRAERVWVRRERPAEGGLDTEVSLVRDGDVFTGHVPLPRSGRWQLLFHAEREGALLEQRLALQGPG